MPRSYGHRLDPKTGESHVVSTHQHWVLENAQMIGVEADVAGLNAEQHEDQTRIIG